jgi:hypothetical protein
VPELKRVEQHSHLSVRRRGCGEARIFGLMSRGWTEAKSITVKLQLIDICPQDTAALHQAWLVPIPLKEPKPWRT